MGCMAMLLVWYFPISRRDLRKQRTHPGDENNANSITRQWLLSSKLGAYRNYVLWITIFIYLLLVTTSFIFEGATVWMIVLLSRSTNYVTVLPRALPKFSSVFTLHCFQVPKHQPVYDLGMSWTHHSTKVSRGFQSLATGAPQCDVYVRSRSL